MTAASLTVRVAAVLAVTVGAVACDGRAREPSPPPPPGAGQFNSGDCNLVSDNEVTDAAGPMFTKSVVSDAGCFWQENTMIGSIGAGMGISTWWYRGSAMDIERTLEIKAGRAITELSMNGNSGFQASDANACSIYLAKGNDVITWSLQTLNPSSMPDLCGVVHHLAQLSQARIN
jgi:hypothetical protein